MFYRLFIPLLAIVLLSASVACAQPSPDAMVMPMDSRLRLRTVPSLGSETLAFLDPGTPLRLSGRTADREWLQVRAPDDIEGWASSEYINVFVDLATVPVTTDLEALDRGYALPRDVAEHVRAIFTIGQDMGNRPDVFAKVGDSITVSNNYLRPIGQGVYNLGDFQYLQGVIDYFSRTPARDGLNSFLAYSAAAAVGWSASAALSPRFADPSQCQPGESPLLCEYRLTRPAVALIMFGTNDTSNLTVATYQHNLEQIVALSIEQGVIPVLSTIPMRVGYEEKVTEFNVAVVDVAAAYDIPLWDYAGAMNTLPGYGLDEDGVHPSIPAMGFEGSADFRSWNLYAGYVLRNLTALQVLHIVWKAIR